MQNEVVAQESSEAADWLGENTEQSRANEADAGQVCSCSASFPSSEPPYEGKTTAAVTHSMFS